MSKCHFNHFLLIEFIFIKNVQMLFFYDYCAYLLLTCVFADSSEKYNEYVYVKKLCFFSLQLFFCIEVFYFLCVCEKLKQDQIIIKKKKIV